MCSHTAGVCRHRLDHVGGEVVGMRAREPDAPDAVDPTHLAQQRANSGLVAEPGTVTSRPNVFTF